MENMVMDQIQVVEPNVDVATVTKKIVTSGQDNGFYVCNISEIIKRYKYWKDIMPRVQTYYAVKCNFCKAVLQTLAAMGTGFDCASMDEIEKVLSLGVEPERIIFAQPTKKISHIKYAREQNVKVLTFDAPNELHKIKKFYPDAKLVLRIKYDDLTARYVLGQKFGADPDTEAELLLQLAKTLELEVTGISFHVGSNLNDYSIFAGAIQKAREVVDMGTRIGFKMVMLDIGGGISGAKDFPLENVGMVINAALEKYFPEKTFNVISEPGRYYVDAAFTLTTSIHSKKIIKAKNDKETVRMYYVDVGIYNGLIPCLFDEFYNIHPLQDGNRKDKKFLSRVWGPTCDCSDKVSQDELLPDMEEGDWIVFECAGAYSTSIACEFNGYTIPKIHFIVNKEDKSTLMESSPQYFPKERFVEDDNADACLTGLQCENLFRTNYF